jgi:hypothetical protein
MRRRPFFARSFQVRRAAERNRLSYEQHLCMLSRAHMDFRLDYAFMQGADWERRRWMADSGFTQTPEVARRDRARAMLPHNRDIPPIFHK